MRFKKAIDLISTAFPVDGSPNPHQKKERKKEMHTQGNAIHMHILPRSWTKIDFRQRNKAGEELLCRVNTNTNTKWMLREECWKQIRVNILSLPTNQLLPLSLCGGCSHTKTSKHQSQGREVNTAFKSPPWFPKGLPRDCCLASRQPRLLQGLYQGYQ